ncbi:uncharacterized protein PFL1_01385 [Pseudozyma flocculosa PF-1]|uniref:uncharacterized protein n=1 Tax=Pseudozyma flocculosa PF-1 TaxID=1277687 RepID=UPI000456075F|nr:uncharacterized protein PFL1_01385 [Pseudozyma flocculosa PF-1]EPQ31197.1 hypothetical protein PFL1_01385 [Pseudozyma flocculosa PF-1]
MPEASSSSSRRERHRYDDDSYDRDYPSRKRRPSPDRRDAELGSRDDRYAGRATAADAASGSGRRRLYPEDETYDGRYSSSTDTDGWGPPRGYSREQERSRRPPSPTWSDWRERERERDRHRDRERDRDRASRRAYEEDAYARGWSRSPSADRRGHHRGGSSRDYASVPYPDDGRRREDDDWRSSAGGGGRRRSRERWRDEDRSSRALRKDGGRAYVPERGRSPSRSRSRSRSRERHRGSHPRHHGQRHREERRRSRDRATGRSQSRPRSRKASASGAEMLVDGEEGELADPSRRPPSRSGWSDRQPSRERPHRLPRDESAATAAAAAAGSKPHVIDADAALLPRVTRSRADPASVSEPQSNPDDPRTSATLLATKPIVADGAPLPRPSPRDQAAGHPSPLDNSSPSHGGASTPRPEMPSPATTVDSKATVSADDAKPSDDPATQPASLQNGTATPRAQNLATAANSAVATVTASTTTTTAPSATSGWRRITGERSRAVETSSGTAAASPPSSSGTTLASPAIPTGPRALQAASPSAAVVAAAAGASAAASSPLTVGPSRGRPATTANEAVASSASSLQADQRPPSPPSPRSASTSAVPVEAVAPLERSFGHVPLPNELDTGVRAKNFLIDYDPALSKHKSRGNKPIKRAKPTTAPDGSVPPVADPRLAAKHGGKRADRGRKVVRKQVMTVPAYEWDKHSVGKRPPPPPRELVVTGLLPRTTEGQLSQQFRLFGRIERQELKLEPTTGQSLGIYSITYVHDFDLDGKPTKEPAAGPTLQNGHEAAAAALKAMDGRRIGTEVIQVAMDRDRAKYKLAYRTELGRRYNNHRSGSSSSAAHRSADGTRSGPPAAAPRDAAEVPTRSDAPGASQPDAHVSSSSSMPPPVVPRGPRSLVNRSSATASPFRASPLHRSTWDSESAESPRRTAAAPTGASSASQSGRSWRDDRSYDRRDSRDSYDRRGSGPASSRTYPASSSYRSRDDRRSTDRRRGDDDDDDDRDDDGRNDVEEPTERILRRLAELGHPYVYVTRPNARDIGVSAMRRHFRDFSPALVTADDRGFYVGFASRDAASRARMVLDKKALHSYHISITVRDAPDADSIRKEALASKLSAGHGAAAHGGDEPQTAADLFRRRRAIMSHGSSHAAETDKAEYTPDELAEATFALIQRELAEHLIRNVKSRIVTPLVTDFMKPSGSGGRLMAGLVQEMASASHPAGPNGTSAVSDEAKLPSFRKKPAPVVRKPDLDFAIPKKASALAKERSSAKAARGGEGKFKKGRAALETSDDEAGSADEEHPKPGRRRPSAGAIEAADGMAKDKPSARKKLPDFSDEDDEVGEASRSVSASVEPSRSVSASVEPSEAGHEAGEARAKARPAKKASKKRPTKKAAAATAAVTTALELLPEEDEGADLEAPRATSKAAAAAHKAKSAKAAKTAPIADLDPFSSGLAEDDEDLFYIKLALERLREGLPITEAGWPEPLPGHEPSGAGGDGKGDDDGDGEAEGDGDGTSAAASQQAPHHTGAARTEGFYRIPAADKAAHLPDRNKKSERDAPSVHALASARNNRADSRRLVLGIEQHKKETASDTDIFKINQLRTRKKQLKFAKSPIHDWGLYAMEKILPGDMVIEYVGEVHCCTPNCNAKILTLNGEKRIVLFARTLIEPGDELTYDYKFQASADDEDAIACLCDSPGCRRFL